MIMTNELNDGYSIFGPSTPNVTDQAEQILNLPASNVRRSLLTSYLANPRHKPLPGYAAA